MMMEFTLKKKGCQKEFIGGRQLVHFVTKSLFIAEKFQQPVGLVQLA